MNTQKNVLLIEVSKYCYPAISKKYIDFKAEKTYKAMQELIKCDTITSATCMGSEALMEKNISMIGDDEALFVENPIFNSIASLLGGYLDHEQALFGNFLVVKHTEDGEYADLSDDEMSLVKSEVKRLINRIRKERQQ